MHRKNTKLLINASKEISKESILFVASEISNKFSIASNFRDLFLVATDLEDWNSLPSNSLIIFESYAKAKGIFKYSKKFREKK